MGSPYSLDRDSQAAASNAFDDNPTVADPNAGAFRDAFTPPDDQLSEEDYRDGADPDGFMAPTPDPYTYPTAKPGGALGF